jgi:hypothetical protein
MDRYALWFSNRTAVATWPLWYVLPGRLMSCIISSLLTFCPFWHLSNPLTRFYSCAGCRVAAAPTLQGVTGASSKPEAWWLINADHKHDVSAVRFLDVCQYVHVCMFGVFVVGDKPT